MVTKDAEDTFLLVVFLILCGLMIAAVSSGTTQIIDGPHEYARGFCTAIDGVMLSNDACNVGGEVVMVTR